MLGVVRDLLEPEFAVVGTFTDGESLVAGVKELNPDVIITDISMPRMSGLEAARLINRSAPDSKIILLTGHDEEALVEEGLSCGAVGYVLKNKAGRDLLTAICSALQDERFVSTPARP